MTQASGHSSALLAEQEYLRRRLQPALTEHDCLHLEDVLAEVKAYAATLPKGARIFDYGCGGAPYEGHFAGCSAYVRADVLPGPKVQVVLNPDGTSSEPDASCDAVLSTQVLEHVPEPTAYLREVFRMLKPGGTSLITTQGMFEEHACPYDYTRWTGISLTALARNCGFEVVRCHKVTAHERAALQLMHYLMDSMRPPGARGLWWLVLAVWRKIYRVLIMPVLNWLGRHLTKSSASVDISDPAKIYVGLALVVRRPVATA